MVRTRNANGDDQTSGQSSDNSQSNQTPQLSETALILQQLAVQQIEGLGSKF